MVTNIDILKTKRWSTLINAPITESEGLGWQMKETRKCKKRWEDQ